MSRKSRLASTTRLMSSGHRSCGMKVRVAHTSQERNRRRFRDMRIPSMLIPTRVISIRTGFGTKFHGPVDLRQCGTTPTMTSKCPTLRILYPVGCYRFSTLVFECPSRTLFMIFLRFLALFFGWHKMGLTDMCINIAVHTLI